ncbi:MAG: ribonuclease R [Tissierellia bacterium]|nr:ribonuclease R [Tissierellia bacterium]
MRIKERIKNELEKTPTISLNDLRRRLGIGKKDRRWFQSVLKSMEDEGSLFLEGKVTIHKEMPRALEGIFLATRKDFGFIDIEGSEDDLFVPPNETLGAMDGDKVRYILLKQTNTRSVAKVIEVLWEEPKAVVGTMTISKKKLHFKPDKELPYPVKITNPLDVRIVRNGKYKAQLETFDKKRKMYFGTIVEFLGVKGEKHVDLLSLVAGADIPTRFQKPTIEEAKQVASQPLSSKDRVDFRDLFTVTIDGLDAKDFDDAISIEPTDKGYILRVHIADVSHYVKEGSLLEEEAFERQMSVYLPGLVLPMLPEVLSNGICSLNPEEDRYALSVSMEVSQGKVPKLLSVDKTIIQSNYRLNYHDLNRYYEKDKTLKYKKDLRTFLDQAKKLYELLKEQSKTRGTISFKSLESKITVDDKGKVVDIRPREEGLSEKLIEECMIATNRAIATKYHKKNLPFLYRVHPEPEKEKLEDLRVLLRPFGIQLKKEVDAKSLQKLLDRNRENESFDKINDMVLRSMSKAEYRYENEGHYALALENYSHFTSPIRRYPDLFIHRVISADLAGKLTKAKIRELQKKAEKAAKRASTVEKIILQLERDAIQLKKCEYMADHIGEIFEGKISGVTDFGLFVQLDNTVQGLINDPSLMRRYVFDADTMTARLKGNSQLFQVGTPVRVQLTRVDMNRLTIDFEWIEETKKNGRKNTRKK